MRRAIGFGLPCLAACFASIGAWYAWRPALQSLLGGGAAGILACELLALALVIAGALALARSAHAPHAFDWVRLLLVALGLGWLAFLACVHEYQRLWLELALGPAAGLVALSLLVELASARWRPGRAKALRVLLLALATGPLLLEGTLRLASRVRPSPLLAREELAPGRVLEQNRPPPGTLRFGAPCNARGHYDEEFEHRREGETRVALIGDSFSQGIVPRELHYSSIAERALGFAVDNLGVAGIGPLEYEQLLVHEALPLDPSAVVIALFVGNDLDLPPQEAARDAWLASWLDRRNVLVWLVPTRLSRMAAESRTNRAGAARVAGERERADPTQTLEQRYPWLGDPLRELATISPEGFLRLERARARQACGLGEPELARVLRVLERMREECGRRPFGVLLIPDEFQVEDALWSELQAAELERDRPQRLLGERLASRGIPVLDLEPVLRGVAPLADGRRHVYHLRDSHWNARGNRAAGEALAGFVRTLLAERR